MENDGVATYSSGLIVNKQKYQTVNYDQESGAWFLKKRDGGAAL